jgi:hypothetical protein
LLNDAARGGVGGAVDAVGANAAVAAVEGDNVRSAEEGGLTDDARAAEGVSGAHDE